MQNKILLAGEIGAVFAKLICENLSCFVLEQSMSYQFTISDIGLRLIKAYEGYRAEPRTLASGNRVIGFGHAVSSDDMSALSEEDAEATLKSDLAPIEDLINTHVHASMTQSQFDALCSLAFSIGEDAFMSSNILHSMNRGQVIEAGQWV